MSLTVVVAALIAPVPAQAVVHRATLVAETHSETKARHKREWRERITPFHYAGHDWAAPYPIALCESGGNYYVGPYGAYGLIMEPPWQSPRQQDLEAHRLYVESGEAPWAPFEGGCAYR